MRRILCISHALPYPPSIGGHQRTALLIRALSRHADVDLLFVGKWGPLPADVAEEGRRNHHLIDIAVLPRRGTLPPWNLIRPISPKIVDRLAHAFGTQAVWYRPDTGLTASVQKALAAQKYDLIVTRHLYPAAMSGILHHPPPIPVVVDVDDVDHLVAAENLHPSVPLYKRLAFARQTRQIRDAALPLFARASHLWVAATQDAVDFEPGRWSLLANIPYLDGDSPRQPCPPQRNSQIILMVATMGYAPNSEAVEHFLKYVWPKVRAAAQGATLRMVGSGMDAPRQARWSAIPGVQAVGFVPDLRDEYQQCAFTIVPVQRGGGTKIKAVECFTFGRTCVVTPHSHRGLDEVLKHRQSLWRANTDDEFAQGCIYLLTHPDERDAWAQTGRELVAQHFNFDRFQSSVDQTLSKFGLTS
jgi:glycosyltransferase involved in cell wall biosynthesis